ncbi:hypothetical protein MtrunA17_Chr4g0019051 [Medicago truncatula]|uniref:Uncharacterized protein n=1 Tax=Medicago truncatula TaxID=3880 RepID=A0A072UUD0_MEDTR|nr:hypothetical protein MTR_4g037055 [Medicago truncatula]RHN59885.1 hypothetical protein MtrunA17_Chr4g0019051 [Medicago truncatula]
MVSFLDFFLSPTLATKVRRLVSRTDKPNPKPQPSKSPLTIADRDFPRGHNY